MTYSFTKWRAGAALFIALLPLTIDRFRYIATDNHWLGSEAAYDYWTVATTQWGVDIVQNVGPLAFIHFPLSFTGFLDTEKTCVDIFLSAVLVMLLIAVARLIQNQALKFVFIFGFATVQFFKAPFSFSWPTEINHYLLALFAAYILQRHALYRFIVPLALLLGVMSLGKGMFLFIAPAIILATSLAYLAQKKSKQAAALVTGYVGGFVISWLAAGQAAQNLPVFIKTSLAFSHGYEEALAGYHPSLIAFSLFALLLALIGYKMGRGFRLGVSSTRVAALTLAGLEAFIALGAWKHAVVSEDHYHLGIFCYYALLCLIPYGCITVTDPLPVSHDKKTPALLQTPRDEWLLTCTALLATLFSGIFMEGWSELFLMNRLHAERDASLQRSIAGLQLPVTREIVGEHTIGYFGELIAPMVYNGLRYRAAPSTISFAGWNASMIDRDEAFYKETATAPDYLLYQLFNTDAVVLQFPPMDSPKAQMQIFRHYDPVTINHVPVEEHGRLLLQRRSESSSPQTSSPLAQREAAMGETIETPTANDMPMQIIVDVPQRLGTDLVKTLYKAPLYAFEYTLDNGQTGHRKFTTSKGAAGFLIAPFILQNGDLLSAISQEEWGRYIARQSTHLHRVTAFRITCDHLAFACADAIHVRFNQVGGLDFGRVAAMNFHY
jgi:hypothetical protein